MARKSARLYIDSDTSGVQRGIKQTQSQLRGFNRSAKQTQGVMSGLGSTASSLGLAFGAAGLAVGIKSSIDAFKEQEKSSARVIATLKTLGVNTDAMRKKIADVTTAQSKLSGFQDEELQASFATILRVTKDVNKSFELNALAMDISRGSGKDLNAVAIAIAKVADGNAGALGRYGIKAQKGATSTDVLAEAQRRYAGQAKEFGDTTAGAAEKANARVNELQESIGAKLAPAMNSAAGATIKMADATGSFIDNAGGIGPLVAGGAGFGAFKLLSPSIANASGAVSALGKVAGKQGAGASMRVLGAAVGASVSPMGAAAVGAGLLAAGVYEIWKNTENANQAVQGLNATFSNVGGAKQQVDVARAAVNTSRDYVNTTKDAEAAARSRARSLRADIAALTTSGASQEKVTAKTKEWHKALKDVVPAVHARQSAEINLKSSQRNLASAIDGVREAQDKQSRKARDVAGKAEADSAIYDRVASRWGTMATKSDDASLGAQRLADRLEKAGAKARDASGDTKAYDDALAGFIRRTQRIPTEKEFRLISNYVHNGLSVDRVVELMAGIRSKDVTVRVNAVIDRNARNVFNAPNPLNPTKRAGGGMIPGSYSQGDRVPAMLSGEEAVLNPKQIDMLGRSDVMSVLRATGAPTDGAGFAGGKSPRAKDGNYANNTLQRKKGVWYYHYKQGEPVPIPSGNPRDVAEWMGEFAGRGITPAQARMAGEWWIDHWRGGKIYAERGYAKGKVPQSGGGRVFVSGKAKTPPTKAELIAAALDKRNNIWSLADAQSALRIARADAAGDPTGNALAYEADAAAESIQIRAINAILANPAKALGIKGARLNRQQRAALLQALASSIGQRTSSLKTAYELRHPAVEGTDTSVDGSSDAGGEGSGPVDTGPTPDQQAILDQKQLIINNLTRGNALSEAALRSFGSSGDIGVGGFGSAFDAARGGPQIAMLGDARSLAAFAGGAVQGMALQGSVSATSGSVNV